MRKPGSNPWGLALALLCLLALAPLTALASDVTGDLSGDSTGSEMTDSMGGMGDMAGMGDMGGDMGMMGGSEESTISLTSVSRSGSGDSRTVSHSKSNTDSTLAYNALELTLSGESATALALGDTQLAMNLTDADGRTLLFSASLTLWNGGESVPEGQAVNTLILTAEAGTAAPWQWRFTGETLKKLRNSGIEWLALCGGQGELLLSTSGFLVGYQYDQWQKSGLAAKAYEYTILLRDIPLSFTCTVTADGQTVTIIEGEGSLALVEGAYRLQPADGGL